MGCQEGAALCEESVLVCGRSLQGEELRCGCAWVRLEAPWLRGGCEGGVGWPARGAEWL